MADVQDHLKDELRWDLIALETHAHVTERRAQQQGLPGDREGLLPSLHLNLACAYRGLGLHDRARHHYELGRAHLQVLDDDDYADQLRRNIADYAADTTD